MPHGKAAPRAVSQAQQRTAAIALHHPGRLQAGNRGMAAMSLHDLAKMAGTPRKGLPRHAPKAR